MKMLGVEDAVGAPSPCYTKCWLLTAHNCCFSGALFLAKQELLHVSVPPIQSVSEGCEGTEASSFVLNSVL